VGGKGIKEVSVLRLGVGIKINNKKGRERRDSDPDRGNSKMKEGGGQKKQKEGGGKK